MNESRWHAHASLALSHNIVGAASLLCVCGLSERLRLEVQSAVRPVAPLRRTGCAVPPLRL
eukprot:11118125-Alexandrium_andersonii.AAC.1